MNRSTPDRELVALLDNLMCIALHYKPVTLRCLPAQALPLFFALGITMRRANVFALVFTAILTVLLVALILAVLPITFGIFGKIAIVAFASIIVEMIVPASSVSEYITNEFDIDGNDDEVFQ